MTSGPVASAPVRWGVTVLAFILIVVHFFTGIDRAPFHGDEAWWVSAGYYYTKLMFVDHDFSPASWSRRGYREWGNLSPPAGKYVIGLSMHAALPPGEYYYPYDFSKDEAWNRERGTLPPPEVLRPGRTASAVASVLTCVTVGLACALAWDWMTGVAAALFLAFNGLFTLLGQRAMTDASLLLFLSIALLCAAAMARAGIARPVAFLLLALAGGVASGVAVSVKFNGAVALGAIGSGLVCAGAGLRTLNPRGIGLLFLAGAVAAGAAIGVAVLLNPMYYTSSPGELLARVRMVLDGWDTVIASQQRIFAAQAISGFPGRAIERLAVDWYAPALTLLALAGIVRWSGSAIDGAFRRKSPAAFALGAACLTTLIALLAWIPLDWDRYYLPMVFALVPFSASGAVLLAGFVYRRFRP